MITGKTVIALRPQAKRDILRISASKAPSVFCSGIVIKYIIYTGWNNNNVPDNHVLSSN